MPTTCRRRAPAAALLRALIVAVPAGIVPACADSAIITDTGEDVNQETNSMTAGRDQHRHDAACRAPADGEGGALS